MFLFLINYLPYLILVRPYFIEKNFSSINPPHNDMVQRSRGVYSGFSRHAIQVSNDSDFGNRKSEERPPFPYN